MSDGGQYLRLDLTRGYLATADGRYIRLNLTPPPPSGELDPDGWSALLAGAHTIYNWLTIATPPSIDAGAFGTAAVTTPTQVTAAGWAQLVMGTPTTARREMPQPEGWESLLGLAGIGIAPWNGRPRPTPWTATQWGTQFVSLLDREVYPATWTGAGIGTPMVSDSPRTLRQRVISTMQFGFPELGWTRERSPSGFEATEWGMADAWDQRQRITPAGFETWASGTADVALYNRYLRPGQWFYQQDWLLIGSLTDVRNARQIIKQAFQVSAHDGGVFGDYPGVRNRNTAYDVQGYVTLRAGRPEIELTADALVPAALDATEWGGGSFIAHSTRTLGAEGADSARFGDYPSVRNAAASLPLPGYTATATGAQQIRNRGIYYPMPAIGDTDQAGEAWVSRSPRTLDAAGRGMYAQQIGTLITGYREQFALPDVIEPTAVMGSVWIVEQFTRATTLQPVPFDEVSTGARVRNVTPEVRPIPVPQDQWGAGAIRTQWRTVSAGSSVHTVWPAERPFIEYRTKRLRLNGWDSFRTRDLHLVELATPSPPPTVVISGIRVGTLIGTSSTNRQSTEFGGASLRENQIEPTGFDTLEWGQTRMRTNGLRPRMITPDADQVGIPNVPGRRFLGAPGEDAGAFGTPLMSPWYIYAAGWPFGTSPDDEPIDYRETRPQVGGPIWGQHGIALRTRFIQHIHPLSPPDSGTRTQFPDHAAALRRRQLLVPTFAPGRIGFPELPAQGAPEPEGFETLQMPQPAVTEIPALIRYLRPAGMQGTVGAPEVQFLHRALAATGMDLTRFGVAWASHEYPPFEMVGWSATQWGDAMVDYRVRRREVQGWDSDEMEYTFGQLAKRMRIAHRPPPVRGPRPAGFTATTIGAPATGARQRTLQASQHYSWAPGYPTVAHLQGLQPQAFETTEWGDPDRVVPGSARPRGEDWVEFGRAALARTLPVPEIAELEFGTPNAGWRAEVDGWAALALAAPVVIGVHDHSCGRFPRAVLAGGMQTDQHGSTAIA